MATLAEIKTKNSHYFLDENGLRQGEYKSWYVSGQLWEHCFYVDGNRHGEYKSWYSNGKIDRHYLFMDDTKLDIDITNITHKDKFILHLKYGDFHWLP